MVNNHKYVDRSNPVHGQLSISIVRAGAHQGTKQVRTMASQPPATAN